MLASASHAAQRTPGTGLPRATAKALCSLGRVRTDRRQSLRRVDADVWIRVRKSIDESVDRRAGAPGPRRPGRVPHHPRPSNRLGSACLNAGWIDSVWGAKSINSSTALRRIESRSCRSRSTSKGIAGGPIRWMISKVTTCRSSYPGLRNRLSKGSERRAPWTRAASRLRGPSGRWPAGDSPSHLPGRGFWRDPPPSVAAVIGTSRPPG